MKRLLKLIQQASRHHANKTALIFRSQRVSYASLEKTTDAISRQISALAVAGEPVGLALHPGIGLVKGLVAILKSGRPYIPINPDGPLAYISLVAENAGLRLVLIDEYSAEILDSLSAEIISETEGLMLAAIKPRSASVVSQLELSYIMYTSGTTGTPKGVLMPTASLEPLIAWQIETSAQICGPSPTTLQFAPSGFDVSFQEIASTLADGGTLVLADEATRLDFDVLKTIMRDEAVARIFVPPVILHGLADASSSTVIQSLREINTAGEQLRLTPALIKFMEANEQCRLVNQYGPTETHVVTAHFLEGAPSQWPVLPPIGKPLPWVDLRVVDEHLRPVANGEHGEILIGGASLAAGYLGLPKLTAERFLANPSADSRFYRTGDLGRLLPDGSVEFLGRADRQIKLRGVRIEPGHIESLIQQIDGIHSCVVEVTASSSSEQKLIACIVPKPGKDGVDLAQQTKRHLSTILPRQMVPSAIIPVAELPLLPNGKMNRLALATLARASASASDQRKYGSESEKSIASIWAEILEIEDPDPAVNFFDLGGNSLGLARALSMLRSRLGIDISMADLLANPTIRSLAKKISGATSGKRNKPLRARVEQGDAIAIIGMSCRFPGSKDPESFWANLEAGSDSLSRWTGHDGALRAEGKLEGIDVFDSEFFGIPPAEAELIDPQHRLFLECTWEAFEDAGYDPTRIGDRVGVFAGCGPSTYLINNLIPAQAERPYRTFLEDMESLKLIVGTDKDYLPTRVAYRLGLTGPAVNVQTACSTSLVAVHLACRSLYDGECQMAIAGAASIVVPQGVGHSADAGTVFSPTGQCRPFDVQADGAVFGSGVGVVLLKRLSEALENGDSVLAIIRGSAINNDGANKIGFIAPSISGQAQVIEDTLSRAKIEPDEIGYIECHGTATALGDAVEIAALAKVRHSASTECAIGSVKSNIGHLGWAAGMAGLIKTVLILDKGAIPPSLHYANPQPELPLAAARLRVVEQLRPWPKSAKKRYAGVSAFGIGGTNAHVVLEEAPSVPPRKRSHSTAVVALSANSASSLTALAERQAAWLAVHEADPMDVAFTLNQGRRRAPWRLAAIGRDERELSSSLREAAAKPIRVASQSPSIGFVYSGHGCQTAGMGLHLFKTNEAFRKTLERCHIAFKNATGEPLLDILYGSLNNERKLTGLELGQPLLFSLQAALTDYWGSYGVTPNVVIGHSLGEYAAAWAAGVFELEDAVRIVAERGRILSTLKARDGATMAAASTPETLMAIASNIGCTVEIAAENSPSSTTISGPSKSIDCLKLHLDQLGIRNRKLAIDVAAHSRDMDDVVDEFAHVLRRIQLSPPRIPLASNVTGDFAGEEIATAAYWAAQLRNTVRFRRGIEAVGRLGVETLLEIGPDATLLPSVTECLPYSTCLASLKPGDEAIKSAECLSALHCTGFDIDWSSLNDTASRRLHLPTYCFERRRYWVGDDIQEANSGKAASTPFAQVSWVDAPLEEAQRPYVSGLWLIVTHSDQFGEAIEAELRRRGAECHRLPACSDENTIKLATATYSISGAIYEAESHVDPSADGIQLSDAVWRNCDSLAALVRAIAGTDVPLWVVTRSSENPSFSAVSSAGLSGISRVIAIEHPELRVHCVDLTDESCFRQAHSLATEIVSGSRETRVRIGKGREFARFTPRAELPRLQSPTFDKSASILVIGGLSGLGLLVAQWATARGAKRLVLAGRSAPNSATMSTIYEMRNRGSEIVICKADVTRLSDVRELLDVADVPNAPLKSVFYTAGILADGPVMTFNERAKQVLRTKIAGTWNLDRASRERGCDLERFVMFSSVVGTIGNAGQASHAAANAALDAFACHLRTLGRRAQSIGWGAWSDIGALSHLGHVVEKLKSLGFGFIKRRDGFELLDALLAVDDPAIACALMNWGRFLELTRQERDPFFEHFKSGKSARQDLREQTEAQSNFAHETIATYIRYLTDRVLPAKRMDLTKSYSFMDLGMDSLTAIEMRNLLQDKLGRRLPPTLLFDFPTVDLLESHLIGLLADTRPTLPVSTSSSSVLLAKEKATISAQQKRWLRLLRANYGRLLVPITIDASFNPKAFRQALLALVERHDVLRWRYEGEAAVVLAPLDVLSEACQAAEDLSEMAIDQQRVILTERSKELRRTMPDPTAHVPWAVRCFILSPTRFLILLSVQHLEFDGVSISIFVDEFRSLYGAICEKISAILPSPTPYSDYVAWQKLYMEGPILEDRAFFQGLYANVDGPLALPLHDGFKVTQGFTSTRLTRNANRGTMGILQQLAAQLKTTPFALMATAYARLVSSISARSDVLIGTIVAGRPNSKFRSVVGPFVAPVPVPLTVVGRTTSEIATRWNDLITFINARSAYPVADLTKHVKAFFGLPEDSYFTDAFIMFNNYQRESSEIRPRATVVECLGPIEDDLLSAIDDPYLPEIAGLFLIIDLWKGEPRFNFWAHLHRFSQEQVDTWSKEYVSLLESIIDEGTRIG